jgi:hypothetical protein
MTFTVDLSKFCTEEAPQKMSEIVREVVIEIMQRVLTRSPVGDPDLWLAKVNGEYVDFLSVRDAPAGYVGGHFRHNWQYGFNSEPSGELGGVQNDALSRVKRSLPVKAGGMHWIVNNTPYAERLETGWSSQAPQGIVGLTELEFPQIVKGITG